MPVQAKWFDRGERGFSTLTVDIQPARHNGPHLQLDLSVPGALGELPPLAEGAVVFAFPPCTHLASSGARWWASKGPEALAEALHLVAIARVASALPGVRWWLIENPVGRLSTHWRKPDWMFDPCDFAGLADNPDAEAYTKRTCLWTNIARPPSAAVPPVLGSRMHTLPDSKSRAYLRALTPSGFARAVHRHIDLTEAATGA